MSKALSYKIFFKCYFSRNSLKKISKNIDLKRGPSDVHLCNIADWNCGGWLGVGESSEITAREEKGEVCHSPN